ncbi:MAG: hypothetical protein ACRD07_23145 [Acidimicrobiales bacterium]
MPAVRPPGDLGTEGRRLWRAVEMWRQEERLVWDPHEAILVAELARTLDRLAAVREAIGSVDAREPSWVRLSSEERQLRLQFARTVSALGLPSGVPQAGEGGTAASRRGQKAARARWSPPPRVVPDAS